jgi:hypothetical protein
MKPVLHTIVTYVHSDPNLSGEAADALERMITVTYSQLRSHEE